MSTEKTAQQTLSGPAAKGKVDKAAKKKQPVVKNIDVDALQIDESFDGACDPYNSTGQFLTDAVKKKFESS